MGCLRFFPTYSVSAEEQFQEMLFFLVILAFCAVIIHYCVLLTLEISTMPRPVKTPHITISSKHAVVEIDQTSGIGVRILEGDHEETKKTI